MLTIKQEKFVQNILKGMSQRDAYKNSYDAKNMKDKTIDDKASLLFKKEEIRARYHELLKKVENRSIMNATERQIWLSKVINGDIKVVLSYEGYEKEQAPDMSDRLKALDILNKMDGQYTTKLEGNLDITIEVGIDED